MSAPTPLPDDRGTAVLMSLPRRPRHTYAGTVSRLDRSVRRAEAAVRSRRTARAAR